MSAWTEAEDRQLAALYAQGLSMRAIAARMGKSSRNAVIGRCHRLAAQGKIEMRPLNRAPIAYKRVLKPEGAVKAKAAGPSLAKVPGEGEAGAARSSSEPLRSRAGRPSPRQRPAGVPALAMGAKGETVELYFSEGFMGQSGKAGLLDLKPGLCRFPVSQPVGPVRYCGDAAEEGTSYCSAHAARCYNTAPPPKVPASLRMGRPYSS